MLGTALFSLLRWSRATRRALLNLSEEALRDLDDVMLRISAEVHDSSHRGGGGSSVSLVALKR